MAATTQVQLLVRTLLQIKSEFMAAVSLLPICCCNWLGPSTKKKQRFGHMYDTSVPLHNLPCKLSPNSWLQFFPLVLIWLQLAWPFHQEKTALQVKSDFMAALVSPCIAAIDLALPPRKNRDSGTYMIHMSPIYNLTRNIGQH